LAAETLEVSTKQIVVVKGTEQEDQTLATLSGAIKSVTIKKIERIGDSTTYTIIIIHDDGTPITVEWSYQEVLVTKGATDILDLTLVTNNGVAQGVDVELIEINGDVRTYGIVDVHLST